MDKMTLTEDLKRVYGDHKGLAVFQTVMPGILKDFLQMLEKSSGKETVIEEYRLEDQKGIIVLEGRKGKGVEKGYLRPFDHGLLP